MTDPATIFLPEIEHTINPDIGIHLQKRMIDGETGCLRAETDWLYPKDLNTRIVRMNNTYCFQPLHNTPFFAGVAIPDQNLMQSKVKSSLISKDKDQDFVKAGIEFLRSDPDLGKIHQIANWVFCTIKDHKRMLNEPASSQYYLTADDLHEYLTLTSKTNFSQALKVCSHDQLLNLLAASSIVSNFTQRHWVDLLLNSSSSPSMSKNIVDVYVITVSGLIIQWSLKPNLSQPIRRDIYEEFRLTHVQSYSQEEDTKHNLIFTVETKRGKPPQQQLPKTTSHNNKSNKSNNKDTGTITMSRGICSKKSSSLIAVIGLTILPDQLIEYITINFRRRECSNLTMSSGNQTSLTKENKKCNFSFDCNLTSKYQCLLIDTAAYVVTSNQGSHHVGHFLGFINGNLLAELTDRGIFTKKIFRDNQADCPVVVTVDHSSNSGSSLQTLYSLVLYNTFQLVFNLLYAVYYNLLYLVTRISKVVYLLATGLVLRSGFDIGDQQCRMSNLMVVNGEQTITTRNVSCIKETPIFTLQRQQHNINTSNNNSNNSNNNNNNNNNNNTNNNNNNITNNNTSKTIDLNGHFKCSDYCSMYFHIRTIEGTNLLSVISTSECNNSLNAEIMKCPLITISNDPVQVFEDRVCNNNLHYRLPRDKCYRSSGSDSSCSFEYDSNKEEGLFFSLILGYSCTCLSIPLVMLFMKYCKQFFY